MSRRLNERSLARAEEITNGRKPEQSTIGGTRAELVERFRLMSERIEADRERRRAQGIEPLPPPTIDEQRAWALDWEAREVERARGAQQRLVDRATGKLGYVSPLSEHVAATNAYDLRQVESAKTMLGIARKMRRHLEAQ